MSNRTADIWSTRLQKELIALTSAKEQSNADTKDNDDKKLPPSNDIPLVPRFVTVREHTLDIIKGICKINFQIEVPAPVLEKISTESTGETEPSEEKTEEEEDDSTQEEKRSESSRSVLILFTLDASMSRNLRGELVPNSPNTYPFQKPKAILTLGAEHFPSGSNISDGDEIEVDCDWTPSLHLTDAATNVSLVIRESIKRGDPFYKARTAAFTTSDDNPIDLLLKRFSMKPRNNTDTNGRTATAASSRNTQKNPSEIIIGDIINLNQAPYDKCAGMFTCRAIRRPQFVEELISEHEGTAPARSQRLPGDLMEGEDENEIPQGPGNYLKLQSGGIRKVAGSGLMGAGLVFRNFISSAKSVIEENFLMVTDTHLIELRSNKLNIGSAYVTFMHPISSLSKLKFRRQESISLFFKEAPEDAMIYMCPDSADAVQQIQGVLKRHGVKGKHTNAATQRAIQNALNIVAEIQEKEKALDENPSVDKVDEIMSLYRQAAERFETAGDARHEEVMNHMRKFLKKPKIVEILEGSGAGSASDEKKPAAPQGEILKPSGLQLKDINDDDDDTDSLPTPQTPLSTKSSNFNNDLDDFDMDDDLDEFLKNAQTPAKGDDDDNRNTEEELDAMFSAADKELSELLNES